MTIVYLKCNAIYVTELLILKRKAALNENVGQKIKTPLHRCCSDRIGFYCSCSDRSYSEHSGSDLNGSGRKSYVCNDSDRSDSDRSDRSGSDRRGSFSSSSGRIDPGYSGSDRSGSISSSSGRIDPGYSGSNGKNICIHHFSIYNKLDPGTMYCLGRKKEHTSHI